MTGSPASAWSRILVALASVLLHAAVLAVLLDWNVRRRLNATDSTAAAHPSVSLTLLREPESKEPPSLRLPRFNAAIPPTLAARRIDPLESPDIGWPEPQAKTSDVQDTEQESPDRLLAPPTLSMPSASAPFDDRAYVRELWERIVRHRPAGMGTRGTSLVEFELDESGRLVSERILQSSGMRLMDEFALQAVRASSPFPPPPPELRGSSLRFQVPVNFH